MPQIKPCPMSDDPCNTPLSCSVDNLCMRRRELRMLSEDRTQTLPQPRDPEMNPFRVQPTGSPLSFENPPPIERAMRERQEARSGRRVSDHLRPVAPSPPKGPNPEMQGLRNIASTIVMPGGVPVPSGTTYAAIYDSQIISQAGTIPGCIDLALNTGQITIEQIQHGDVDIWQRVGTAMVTFEVEGQ